MSNARERKQIGLKTAELRILKLEEKTMLRLADQIRDQLNRLKVTVNLNVTCYNDCNLAFFFRLRNMRLNLR